MVVALIFTAALLTPGPPPAPADPLALASELHRTDEVRRLAAREVKRKAYAAEIARFSADLASIRAAARQDGRPLTSEERRTLSILKVGIKAARRSRAKLEPTEAERRWLANRRRPRGVSVQLQFDPPSP